MLKYALPYIEDDSAEVRKAAVFACCRLLTKDSINNQSSGHSLDVINGALCRLLTAGIADPGRSYLLSLDLVQT